MNMDSTITNNSQQLGLGLLSLPLSSNSSCSSELVDINSCFDIILFIVVVGSKDLP